MRQYRSINNITAVSGRWQALVFSLTALLCCATCEYSYAKPGTGKVSRPASSSIVIRPVVDDTMLINPGKGWVEYGDPDPRFRDIIGVGYCRTAWCNVEPSEGKFDWSYFDAHIANWAKEGKKGSFGVINFDGGMGKQYSIPKWVFDAGAEPIAVPDGSTPTGTMILPKTWDDPVYLAKTKAFIKAFGARYNGNPNLAYVDIRDYGNSGECNGGYDKVQNTSMDSFQNNFLAPYIQAFPNTQLIVPWTGAWFDGKPVDPVYVWAVSKGVGMRRDGICSPWSKDGSECLMAYGHEPIVYEYGYTWSDTVKEGYAAPEILTKYIEAGKPSYLQFHSEFYDANKDFCYKLGNRIGYHFILQEVTIPAKIVAGKPFPITWQWINDGVAPLHEPCSVAMALLDKNDKPVRKQWITKSKPNGWRPDTASKETLTMAFGSVPAGTYKLAVGLFMDKQDAKPAYRLGIQGRSDNGWYVLYDKLPCK